MGLSIPILGVLGLFCLSNGLRDLVGDTLSRIEGLIILRENVPSPVFSHLPASLADELKKVPGSSRDRTGGLGNRPHDRGAGHAGQQPACRART